jgi:hypothetical protein
LLSLEHGGNLLSLEAQHVEKHLPKLSKLESILRNEAIKKDVAAAVAAAILITISTSGDFQRKWQANRTAAAELERIGYDFLEKSG